MELEFRFHALRRMIRRGIRVQEVEQVIATGVTIETYPDDRPFPSKLVLGWVGGRPLHVAVAENRADDMLVVVTVYEPDLDRWEPGFRVRRGP